MRKSRLSNERSGLEGFTDAAISMVAISTGAMMLLATITMVATMPLPMDHSEFEDIVNDNGVVRLERLDVLLKEREGMNVRVMAIGHGVVWSSGDGDILTDATCRPVLVSIDGRAIPGRVISWCDPIG